MCGTGHPVNLDAKREDGQVLLLLRASRW